MPQADVYGLTVPGSVPAPIGAKEIQGGGWALMSLLAGQRIDGAFDFLKLNNDNTLITNPLAWRAFIPTYNTNLAGLATYTSSIDSATDWTMIAGFFGASHTCEVEVQQCDDGLFTASRFAKDIITIPDTERGVVVGDLDRFEVPRIGNYVRVLLRNLSASTQTWVRLNAGLKTITR